MNDSVDNHEPTAEFTEYLARDLSRRLRHDARFGPSGRPATARLGRMAAFAASAIFIFAIGLVWGANTGFASADLVDARQRPRPFAILERSPVRKAIAALTCSNIKPTAAIAEGQQGVPIIDLPPATAKTPTTLGSVLAVRELPGGKLLVNDFAHHQMKLLDSTLVTVGVPMDSVPGTASSYGLRPLPLVRYLGDSSLSADVNAGTLLMLGPDGKIARAVASPYVQTVPPYANLTTALNARNSGVDDKGRILFHGFGKLARPGATTAERVAELSRDSAPVMRVDLESRRLDTVTWVRQGGVTALMGRVDDRSPVRFSRMPVEIIDVWGVLSDGSIAIVRGQDYHIDWIHPDGTRHSTTKLPFDWKRLTDEDKQRLIDSTRVAASAAMGAALAQQRPAAPPDATPAAPGARVFVPPEQREVGRPPMPVEYVAPELKDIPDYYPSLRIGAAIPDLDGNLWILPNSSAQSKNGELVYDVVNVKGDFHRVRLPVGRSIVGFGKGGVVFLLTGDRATGFNLERTRLPAAAKTAPMK